MEVEPMLRPLLAGFLALACACHHAPATDARPPDPAPTPASLEDAATGVDLLASGLDVAAALSAEKNPIACAVETGVAAIGHAAAASLHGEASGVVVYGEVAFDATPCGDLHLTPIDVPATVDKVVGPITLALGAQVNRADGLTCEDKARVKGALAYVEHAVGPVVAALRAVVPKVTIPGASITLEGCSS